MPELPTGTLTLLFTDMEGSTRLLQQLGERYADVLAQCRQVLRNAFAKWQGQEVDTQGDAFFMVFVRASDAVGAAVDIQRALAAHRWPQDVAVRVRIGLHTGEPQRTAEGYVGLDVHHAARIMSAGHGGQILLSQATRGLVEQSLPDGVQLQDLGEHRLKDLRRPSRLFQLLVAGLPSDFPPLKTLDRQPHNLPIEPTPFIGREREVAALCRLLARPEVRLVTLTGAGGMGKTRLALQVAAQLSDQFADGVFLVALAPLSEASLVLPTIVQTLSISEVGGQSPLALLKAALKDKLLLLVLDNFEQVSEAAVPLADLLAACPKLKLIVTSRVVLHVQAEREFPVPPLSLPNLKRLPDLATLSQYEAVALFIERAQAVKPDFAVTNATAPAVAGICARLDGMPLAIELAAARVKLFPPHTLLTRLEQGLSVLSGGARDLPLRQQTLRGAMAWSYNLLSGEEQTLFRRLSVFVDGCAWEAAEQVCQASGGLSGDILEGLGSLLDKSLLRQEGSSEGEPRFWMLQLLREFGLEVLESAGETEVIRQAHAEHYLRLAEEAAPHLRGSEQEHENLRAALTLLLEQAQRQAGTPQGRAPAERVLRLCDALYRFWWLRSYWLEGQAFLEQALALLELLPAGAKRDKHELSLQLALAPLYWVTKGWAALELERVLDRALALCDTVGDDAQRAETLYGLQSVYVVQAKLEKVQLVSDEMHTLYQRSLGTEAPPFADMMLAGSWLHLGRITKANARFAQIIAAHDPDQLLHLQESQGSNYAAHARAWQAHALWCMGYPQQALSRGRDAVKLALDLDQPFNQALTEAYLALLQQLRADKAVARQHAEQAYSLASKYEAPYYRAWADILVSYALALEQPDEEHIGRLRGSITAFKASGARLRLPYYLTLLAQVCGKAGRAEEGLACIDEALVDARTHNERWWDAEVHRLRGELLLMHDADASDVEATFLRAIEIARARQARSLELRAAMSLARLWSAQDRSDDARRRLEDVYNWFTEGFENPDLQAARLLLAQL